jgi:hypothetical protein
MANLFQILLLSNSNTNQVIQYMTLATMDVSYKDFNLPHSSLNMLTPRELIVVGMLTWHYAMTNPIYPGYHPQNDGEPGGFPQEMHDMDWKMISHTHTHTHTHILHVQCAV